MYFYIVMVFSFFPIYGIMIVSFTYYHILDIFIHIYIYLYIYICICIGYSDVPAIDPQGSNPGSPRSSSRGRDPAEISGSFPNFPNEKLHF